MNRMKQLREEAEKKQIEIGELLNVSQSTYSDWETDKHMPDKDSLFKLAEIYDTSIDYMLGYSRDRKAPKEKPLRLLKEYLASKISKDFSENDLVELDEIYEQIARIKK